MKYFSSIKLMRGALATLFFSFALLLLPNLAAAQSGNQAADREMKQWRLFEPTGGNFRVSLPTQPAVNTVPFETDYSTLDLHVFTAKTASSLYTVNYIDLVDISFRDAKSTEAGFNKVRSEIMSKNPSAVSMGEKKIMLGKLSGRESVFDDGSNVIRLQMYLVKQRGYIVAVVSPQTRNLPEALAKVYRAEADKFFSSFQIMDNKKPEVPAKAKKTGK